MIYVIDIQLDPRYINYKHKQASKRASVSESSNREPTWIYIGVEYLYD